MKYIADNESIQMDGQPPDVILLSPHEIVEVGYHWAVHPDSMAISSTAFLSISDLQWSLHAPVGLGFPMLGVSKCRETLPPQLIHVF